MQVTPRELDLLREEVQRWYSDTCDIYRPVLVDDAYGGTGETSESAIRTGVECFLESTPGREQIIPLLASLRGEHIYIVYLPATEDVRVGDHLMVTSRGNLHLRVQAVMNPESLDIEYIVAASTLGEH